MAYNKHASKRTAQILENSSENTPIKSNATKIPKYSSTPKRLEENKREEKINLEDIHDMMMVMMKRLDKLDVIEDKLKSFEHDIKEVKKSVEFAHAEIDDLKTSNLTDKTTAEEMKLRLENLEKENNTLKNSVIDLKARSMRDNLLFFNIPEKAKENTTQIIHQLLEEKMDFKDASTCIKIDRSHRLGKRREEADKPRPIVAKFNYHQDKEAIRMNAKKLKGTGIGIADQYPEEIEKVRKCLYPELRRAKAAGKRANIVRDKLIIDGVVFNPSLK